jgi:hypothetical protein
MKSVDIIKNQGQCYNDDEESAHKLF